MASLKEDDEMVQEAALNELTELMSMSSEEALTVLPLEQLVPQLVITDPNLSLLDAVHTLLSCRPVRTVCSRNHCSVYVCGNHHCSCCC